LPYVTAAYRTSRQETTEFTPNFLRLRTELRAPVDLVYDAPETSSYVIRIASYADEMSDRMRVAYALERKHLKIAAQRN